MVQPPEALTEIPVLPALTCRDVLACQFSSWYPAFEKQTIRAKIIRPIGADFESFLHADGISVPDDGDDDDEDDDEASESDDDTGSESSETAPRFSFPELTNDIRAAIQTYGAVFPKLNWTAPRDASWMMAPSTPLKCTSPADVYLFLKSSDFVAHDLEPATVFEGCIDAPVDADALKASYALELVLKKWYMIETSREFRCFVRDDSLIGISQRDTTFYEYLNEDATYERIRSAIITIWKDKIKPIWTGGSNYIFDILITRDMTKAHIIDFNPFAPRTDGLLFTYEDLRELYASSLSSPSSDTIPEFRVITSRTHPAANRATPQYAHNMMPREALELSAGQNIAEFQQAWEAQLKDAVRDESEDGESGGARETVK